MKELIILGKGNSRVYCPYDCEVWGINDVYKLPDVKGKRIDKLFAFDDWPRPYITKMRRVAPVVSWRDYATEKYPIEEVKKRFKTEYFNNTSCYMIALAIYLGYEKIRVYGLDHPIGSPWFEDRTGVEYWLGRAQEAGIEVETAKGSQLLRTLTGKVYGETGDANITLYLFERRAILNLIPKKGDIRTMRIAAPLQFKMGFPQSIVDKYFIVEKNPDGTLKAANIKEELAEDFIFTRDEFDLIKEKLIEKEKQGELAIKLVPLWEKFAKFYEQKKFSGSDRWLSRSVIKPTGSALQ